MENQEKMNVWAAISGQGPWDQQPQEYLGYVTWREAVEWAKRQPKIVRLSLTSGYHNQGHYIR